MDTQESILQNMGETVEYAHQYLKREIALFKLEATEKSAKSTASIITLTAIAFLVGMVLLMFSIAAGFCLGNIMGSYAYGFLVIAAIYAVIALIVYFNQKKLITEPVLNIIIKSFFD